jgi:hypothetical protein
MEAKIIIAKGTMILSFAFMEFNAIESTDQLDPLEAGANSLANVCPGRILPLASLHHDQPSLSGQGGMLAETWRLCQRGARSRST